MQGPQLLTVLCCLGTALAAVLGFEVAVFRVACALCGVPQPGAARTFGLVLVLLAVPAVVDGVGSAVLYEVYTAAGYPLWEAGLVEFFIALPVHMVICSTIHAQFMRVKLGQGLAVWLVEKVLKFGVLTAAVGAAVLIFLAVR